MSVSSTSFGIKKSKIAKLIPPDLSKETLLEKIVCTRPMRQDKFNISLEEYPGKQIVHCYGMGGAGWTTLFGSVRKAIELFEATKPKKSVPIRVIGAGCMGLTCAIELKRLGYLVKGITAEDLYELPSWKAAGYFALVSVKTSKEEQATLKEIGINTFCVYQEIEKGKHPYITSDAVRFMPVYASKDTDAGVEELEVAGIIPPKEEVTLDFGNNVLHPHYLKYMTYFMNTTILMKQFKEELDRLKVSIQVGKVSFFSEIEEEVIFNCSGMGAKQLNNDESLIPVRGHLVSLTPDSSRGHMDYMIFTKEKFDGNEEYIYSFPKTISVTQHSVEGIPCNGILGGSFLPHVDQLSLKEQEEVDEREFARLLERNSQFFLGRTWKR